VVPHDINAKENRPMAAERFYIHRCANTDSCALTRAKGEPRLAAAACSTCWELWMQITRHQVEDGRYSFVFDAAITKIEAEGYYLFTGSPKLLGRLETSSPNGLTGF
jgi:hypothetical protein